MFFISFSSMSYQDSLYNTIMEQIHELHVKYMGYEDLLTLTTTVEHKHYGIKVKANVTDLNPEPVDVINLTVRILYAEELPLLQKFIETLDYAIANILDLYENTLPVIEPAPLPEIDTD